MGDRQQADGLVGTNMKQTKLVRLCSSLVETRNNIDIEGLLQSGFAQRLLFHKDKREILL